jgi:hypothetical protein
VQLRLQPRRWFVYLNFGVAILFAIHVYMSAWMVVEFDGVYEEGKPSPTEIHALVVVDADQTYIDVEMEKATSFFIYSFSRNNTSVEETQPEEQDEGQNTPSDTDFVDLGRTLIFVSLLVFVGLHGLYLTSFRWTNVLLYIAFVWILLSFFIVFPTLYVYDLGSGRDGSLAYQNFASNDVEDSLLHQDDDVDWHLTHRGIEIETSYSGYDVGLVAKKDLEDARNSTKQIASENYSHAYIQFGSTFSFQVGKNIPVLYTLPIFWLIFPMVSMSRTTIEEE